MAAGKVVANLYHTPMWARRHTYTMQSRSLAVVPGGHISYMFTCDRMMDEMVEYASMVQGTLRITP